MDCPLQSALALGAGVSRPFAQTADKKKHVVLTAPGENGFVLALDRFLTERYRHQQGRGA